MRKTLTLLVGALAIPSFAASNTMFHVESASRRPVVLVAQSGTPKGLRNVGPGLKISPNEKRDWVAFASPSIRPKLTYRVLVQSAKGTELGHVDFDQRVLQAGKAKGIKLVVQNGSVLVNVGSRRFRVILLPENFVRE